MDEMLKSKCIFQRNGINMDLKGTNGNEVV